MDKNILKVVEELGRYQFNVFEIGTNQGKDCDLVIIGNGKTTADSINNLKFAIEVFRSHLVGDGAPLIVLRLDHFGHVSKNSRPLHLLFYPTVIHFIKWELPSFNLYVSKEGKCLLGSATIINEYKNFNFSTSDTQFFAYSSRACSNCLYSCGINGVVPRHFLSLQYRYTLRHAVLEILRNRLNYYPFNFTRQIELLKENYSNQREIPKLMQSGINYLDNLSTEKFYSLNFQLFKMIEMRDIIYDQ